MSKNVTDHRKIVWEWNKPLGDPAKPYAYRWRLDFYYFSFRVHKWICSDDDRAYHSHPVNMLILIIKGKYIDHYLYGPLNLKGKRTYTAPGIRYIGRDYKHWVEIIKPSWTLLFTWGTPKRWGFWLRDTLRRKNRDKYFIEHGNHICNH